MFGLGFFSLIVFVGAAAVGPYINAPNSGQFHGANEVWVDTPSDGEMSLQTAIDNGLLGGGSTGGNNLVNGEHSSDDCSDDGGSVRYTSDGAFCEFPGENCHADWKEFKNWKAYDDSATIGVFCAGPFMTFEVINTAKFVSYWDSDASDSYPSCGGGGAVIGANYENSMYCGGNNVLENVENGDRRCVFECKGSVRSTVPCPITGRGCY